VKYLTFGELRPSFSPRKSDKTYSFFIRYDKSKGLAIGIEECTAHFAMKNKQMVQC
jgi:hypothetical protein